LSGIKTYERYIMRKKIEPTTQSILFPGGEMWPLVENVVMQRRRLNFITEK